MKPSPGSKKGRKTSEKDPVFQVGAMGIQIPKREAARTELLTRALRHREGARETAISDLEKDLMTIFPEGLSPETWFRTGKNLRARVMARMAVLLAFGISSWPPPHPAAETNPAGGQGGSDLMSAGSEMAGHAYGHDERFKT